MVAPVRFKPSDENDLAIPAREITSRHRVDRRSLLLPRRVMLQLELPSAASAEVPLPPLGQSRLHVPTRPRLEHDAAPAADLSGAMSPDRMRDRGERGKHRHFANGQDTSRQQKSLSALASSSPR